MLVDADVNITQKSCANARRQNFSSSLFLLSLILCGAASFVSPEVKLCEENQTRNWNALVTESQHVNLPIDSPTC